MPRTSDSAPKSIKQFAEYQTNLVDIQIDDVAASTQLRSWELVQIPPYLRRYGWWAIRILVMGFLLLMFVPWTQTITTSGQLSAYSPYERPQDIEAQIQARLKKWHVFEGVRVKQGELILELEDIDPNEVRELLLPYCLENLQRVEENLTDVLRRLYKL